MLGLDISDWIDKGLGVASFVALIALIIFYAKNLKPILSNMQSTSATHSEVIRNNTDAIKEVSRSNDNVAKALSMLNVTFEANNKTLEKHDDRAAEIQTAVTRIDERTMACLRDRRE